MILKDQHKLEIEYKARYVRGQGWYSESQVKDLNNKGYEIRNNMVKKINK
jgi:hypothetical protein